MANKMEEDIISTKLTEHLISQILSLLLTKDAVRTCILSKRWINRWISITKLDLDDNLFYTFSPTQRICDGCKKICDYVYFKHHGPVIRTLCHRCYTRPHPTVNFKGNFIENEILEKQQHFVNFAYKTILLTGTNSSISSMQLESFSLVISNNHNVSHLNAWIFNILTRRVKKLKIHSPLFKLPLSTLTSCYLFNSTLLEELDLSFMVLSTIHVPTCFVRFGHLKLLNLSGIFFKIDPSSDYLTLSLPVLTMFEMKNCTWSSEKNIVVEAPLLESISLQQDLNHHPHSCCAIKFTTLCLKGFSYCGYGGISQKISLSDSSFLSFAFVSIILKQCENKVSETRCLALHLLQHFHQVEFIKFEGLEVLTQVDIPVFAKLSQMELGSVPLKVILGLLQKSHVLKTLVLREIPSFGKDLLNSAAVPDCLASTLEIVKFEKVIGDKHELFLARFFIENGMMLERMGFSPAKRGKSKIMEEFKKLYSINKALEFSYD